MFGYIYRSRAVITEGDMSRETFENPREPSGRPGSRAPHIVLEHTGASVSSIDLCLGKWTLLAGPRSVEWCDLAAASPEADAIHLHSYRLGANGNPKDTNDRWRKAYGVDEDGAVLVRPDAMVAWRSQAGPDGNRNRLRDVLRK